MGIRAHLFSVSRFTGMNKLVKSRLVGIELELQFSTDLVTDDGEIVDAKFRDVDVDLSDGLSSIGVD